jgi:peptidoglycan hydrolase CwlO-like protein
MEKIKKYKTIVFLLIGLFILYLVFSNTTNTMSVADKAKLDSLTNVINGLNKELDVLEGKIEHIDEEVDKIDDNISKIKTNKEKTGKKYHEEINRVDKYTEPEIDKFFSDRYK